MKYPCCRWPRASLRGHRIREGERRMMFRKLRMLTCCMSVLLVGSTVLLASAQQAAKSDLEAAQQGAIALAASHGEKPRYGGTFLSAGNEEISHYDMHQTSLGGIYAAVSPAYNCLIRTSPYDPMALDIIPELAETWEISDEGKTITFHLHQGVQWHDGTPFSSADVQYTFERIMHPPQGMVSPRGPVFAALIERIEAALLSKRVFWSDAFPHPNMDRDMSQSAAQQNSQLVRSSSPMVLVYHLTLQTEKPPFDDLRVRQALSEALQREAFGTLGTQSGAVGTGNYPFGPWGMPTERRHQLIGYGPDMAKRLAHAKALLASYEKEKGKIDWSKLKVQCASNIKLSCENGQIMQQLLKKINVNIELQPMILSQLRANEISGNYFMSLLGAASNFDDPIDTFGQLFVTNGGRWYQRRSLPALDALFEQQKFMGDSEARKQVVWEMDTLAMNDAAYLILLWPEFYHVRWHFVKGWTH